MRKLSDVIGQLLEVTPESEEEFRSGLLEIKESLDYCPPEASAQRMWWRLTAELFEGRFKDEPTEGWGKEAIDIWMDRK